MALVTSCLSDVCANGTIQMTLTPLPSGFFPPAIPDPGYTIEPCDTVTWDFGDGTPPATVTGTNTTSHNFPLPGNYTIVATVTNTRGSRPYSRSVTIANAPSKIAFAQPSFTALETAGSITIALSRTLDLSRTIVVSVENGGDSAGVMQDAKRTITFEPNETAKSFAIPIHDDHVYEGTRHYSLSISVISGGAYTNPTSPVDLAIVDDEPVPTLTFENTRIVEGDEGATNALVPVHLSAPLARPLVVWGFIHLSPNGATSDDLSVSSQPTAIPAGATSGLVPVTIYGDRRPEPDETFSISMPAPGFVDDPTIIGGICTIANDDATLSPSYVSVAPNETTMLHVDIGNPVSAPTTLNVTSSAPDVLAIDPIVLQPGSATADVKVQALMPGTAFLEIPFPDGRHGTSARATINVRTPGQLAATPSAITMVAGEEKPLAITIVPGDATDQMITIAADDPSLIDAPKAARIPASGTVMIAVRGLRTGSTQLHIASGARVITVSVIVAPPGRQRGARH